MIDSPKLGDKYFEGLASQLLQSYKLIVLVGLPCTGKTTLVNAAEVEGCLTHWNRQTIFEMLFRGGERDEKYNTDIAEFEGELIPKLIMREHHTVVIDGYNRMPTARRRQLGFVPSGLGRTAAICFDGPPQEIVARMLTDERYSHMSGFEIEEWVKQMHQTTVWPTYDEGFNDIWYVNTFGESGLKMLQQLVVKRKA